MHLLEKWKKPQVLQSMKHTHLSKTSKVQQVQLMHDERRLDEGTEVEELADASLALLCCAQQGFRLCCIFALNSPTAVNVAEVTKKRERENKYSKLKIRESEECKTKCCIKVLSRARGVLCLTIA